MMMNDDLWGWMIYHESWSMMIYDDLWWSMIYDDPWLGGHLDMFGKTTTCRLTAFNQAATGGSSYEPERKPLEIITPSTLSGMLKNTANDDCSTGMLPTQHFNISTLTTCQGARDGRPSAERLRPTQRLNPRLLQHSTRSPERWHAMETYGGKPMTVFKCPFFFFKSWWVALN